MEYVLSKCEEGSTVTGSPSRERRREHNTATRHQKTVKLTDCNRWKISKRGGGGELYTAGIASNEVMCLYAAQLMILCKLTKMECVVSFLKRGQTR